jgi:hypothetical protein
MLANEADRLVFSGNSALYQDRAYAVYEERLATYEAARDAATNSSERAEAAKLKPIWNVTSLYAMTPETYTVYTAQGLPNLGGAPSPSGVGHQNFTLKQIMEKLDLLDTYLSTSSRRRT